MSAGDPDSPTDSLQATPEHGQEHIHIPDLPWGVRIALLIVGWLVVIVGLAGLLLPGLQGLLLIIVGAAILSVASDSVHRWLERLLERRPRIRERLNRFRQRVHSRLGRRR